MAVLLEGFEGQDGGNVSMPMTGSAVVQATVTIMFGLTSTTTAAAVCARAPISASNNFNGAWADYTATTIRRPRS